jgi:NADH-quinone oxidoreductase subunit J
MTVVIYQIIDFILIHKVLLAFIIPTLALSYFTVTARSPIHSILSLIVTFLMVAFIFIMYYSLPFIGTLLIVIYVGAIAILFLFVIMMIPMRDKDSLPLTPIPAIVNFVFFVSLLGTGLYLFFNQTVLDIFVSD